MKPTLATLRPVQLVLRLTVLCAVLVLASVATPATAAPSVSDTAARPSRTPNEHIAIRVDGVLKSTVTYNTTTRLFCARTYNSTRRAHTTAVMYVDYPDAYRTFKLLDFGGSTANTCKTIKKPPFATKGVIHAGFVSQRGQGTESSEHYTDVY